jgi:hypothetical protein
MLVMRRRPALTATPVLPVLATVLAATLLSACGSDEKDPGVASLQSATSSPSASASGKAKDSEAELLKYVECLRGQGLDVPDPTVDAEGNLAIGGGGNGGPPNIDPDKLAAAQKVCGDVPAGALGGGTDLNSPEFQDAAVKFAACMREEGIDVPDPDFSKGSVQGMTGLFKNVDRNDPKVEAATRKCRSVFADAGIDLPGGNG